MDGLGNWRGVSGMGTSTCYLDQKRFPQYQCIFSEREQHNHFPSFYTPKIQYITFYNIWLYNCTHVHEHWRSLLTSLWNIFVARIYTTPGHQRGYPVLPVLWRWCRSSLSEKGGVLGLCLLSLCSPCPGSLPFMASLQWSPVLCEDLGESWSWHWERLPQLRVRWLVLASRSPDSVLRNTSPLILGSGGLRVLSWPDRVLSHCSLVMCGASLTWSRLQDDKDLSDTQSPSCSSMFSDACLGFSFLCFTALPSLWRLQDLEYPEPRSLALLDLGWSEWR